MTTQTRPDIQQITTGAELRRWYWLKSELVVAARAKGLKSSGAKFDILERIAHFLDTGARDLPQHKRVKVTSDLDWHAAPLDDGTVITDSYRNTQNVRRYFKAAVGPKFSFNIAFMEWIKSNQGNTLKDADKVCVEQQEAARSSKSRIKPHNQFNKYTRDFMVDNSAASMAQMRRAWEKKRALPSQDGRHVYHPSDLTL